MTDVWKIEHDGGCGVIDWVVAPHVGDAVAVVLEHAGPDYIESDDIRVSKMGALDTLTVRDDGEGGSRKQTCEAWAEETGCGFLCSTEW